MKSFCSSLTFLLILVAVLSTPAAAAKGKLRKSGNGNRKLMKKDAKCTKNTKDSCISLVMETWYGKQEVNDVSYGNGKNTYDNKVVLEAIAVGTKWIAVGGVADPDTLELDDETGKIVAPPTSFVNEDYHYYAQCTVLAGRIKVNGQFVLGAGDRVPLVCQIDICYGTDWSEENVADCVFLRGLTKGRLDASDRAGNEQLNDVLDFKTTVIGGTGRFTGVIGIGDVFPSGDPGGANPDGVPNGSYNRSWRIELDTTVSPWYGKEKMEVPLPEKLDFSAVTPP